MLTLRNLRYFQALARHEHFGRAAEACSITQPALSMQIRELEAHLGEKLVERSREGVRLTETGRETLKHAERILSAVADLESQARRSRPPLSGPFRLGVIPSVAPYLLPRLLPAVRRRVPDARLSLRETRTAQLVEELMAGQLDAVILSLPLHQPELTQQPLFDDPFLLAVGADSQFAENACANEAMLGSDDLLLLEDGHCFRDQALEVCRTLDAGQLRSYGATSLSTLIQLVANGQGITLVPQLFVSSEAQADPRVKMLHFPAPAPQRTIGLAWRRAANMQRDIREIAEAVRTSLPSESLALAYSSGASSIGS
ncbi:LysR family transcriptional regulator [Agaricicola taiwanensis]|uniref:LysR family transcriptional regulator n=1 Tax=Agaricicola taiwanensis TaxID=591372 RepID=A0A8J2YJ99_9RHOB|nr:hydrogen peroxide-inducible genes activator [Agaricicola taiwanensis]GGE47393.1 LysR family transcriptional regulator [Agaricicola taiwanensis]